MSDKSILLITGGNTGLGLETVKALANTKTGKAFHIIIGSRKLEAGEKAIAEVQTEFPSTKSTFESISIDVQDDASISKAFEHVKSKFGHLDVLLNNAGAGFDQEMLQGKISMREAWNKAYDINVTGTSIMVHTFLPILLKASDPRILFITSGTSTLAKMADRTLINFPQVEPGYPKDIKFSYHSYQASKTGMNMMYLHWERLLENDNIKLFAVSPGFLATGLQSNAGSKEENAAALKKMGALDPSVGGETVRMVVEGERDGDAGKIVLRDGVQAF
ncbi:NAD(P)-binding protein [Pseudovirgaria hyperparasitica]|uniref:NAD(P)-binding protein n=1 Tax=Pseudovirgaria hyperparasitica TaxID=470096 RepID=A0A6A6W8P4_9PEZI|nr:NAD(P)-binding protein [Pseudovirgaria hyperparasitica]KAF2757451.1 NAD(P)-binding protein [Pseudovirgaria hyperparasitica]